MHNFKVTIADCSYMFQLSQSNHHQAVYKCKKELFYITKNGNYITVMLEFILIWK